MIDGVSSVDWYGMASQTEEVREKGTAGSTLKFEEVYEKASGSMDLKRQLPYMMFRWNC